MPTYTKLLWTLLLVGVCAPSLVAGDTFLTHPVSYSRADLTNRGCKNTGKNPSFDCSGPCDVRSPTDQTPPTVVQRGEDLRVSWVKNGHKGGFVRMSLLKRNEDQSDVLTQDRFDANAEKTVCFEPYLSCELSSSMTYSGAEGVALNSYNCSTSLNIRQQLQDGLYTLQWIWFGGISSGDHYSCSDIRVSGGPTLEFSTIRFPEWQGGDVYYPGEPRCNYYNARKRGMCIYDQPCTNNTDVNDPYRFLGTDEWRANAPDEGQYDELDPIPLQSPAQTQTPTPIPVNTDDSKKSSDDAVTVALGVGLPAIAAAMVLGAVLWVKKHPVPTQPATAASVGYSMNMLSATPPNEYTRDHRLRLSSGTNLASSANLV